MKNITFPIKYTSLNIIKTHKNKITNTITKNNLLRKEDVKKKFVVIKVKYTNYNQQRWDAREMCKKYMPSLRKA